MSQSQPPGATTESPGKIRLFLAVPFPSEVKASLEELTRKLRTGAAFTGAHPAWVKVDSLHVTLVFLGWVETAQREAAERALRMAAGVGNFRLKLAEMELFPTPKNPRVISIGLHGDIDALKRLQDTLAEACKQQGFVVEDRAFRPHVTLARLKSQKGLAGIRDLVRSHAHASAGEFQVRSAVLFRSILKPAGAEYTVFAEQALAVA